ncbi:MAG: hypothetical protein RIS94_2457 [Pseudomonadota bacterium]|jgi:hypothetical protein
MNDPAFGRFMVLQLVRLSGALLALGGVVLLSGRFGTYPVFAGYALVGAGLVDFFGLPPLLARRWKSR